MSLPQFRKRYRPSAYDLAYRLSVLSSKAARRAGVMLPLLPETLGGVSGATSKDVLKSISLLSRAQFVRAAFPRAKIIHLLRHPCGYVSSRLAGEQRGLMSGASYVETMATAPYCVERGITIDYLASLQKDEQLAYGWLAMNEFAIEKLAGDESLTISYDRLCQNPSDEFAPISTWAGLPEAVEVERFIARSTSGSAKSSTRYYSVKKNPLTASTSWKAKLSREQIDRITRVVEGTRAGSFALARSE